MKASKLASSDQERARLRSKCQQLLSKAEEIKQSVDWTPEKNKELLLKAPSSERPITRRENVILLESSKLHGFVFPPWTSEPDDSVFDETVDGSPPYT
jgi:calpain-7